MGRCCLLSSYLFKPARIIKNVTISTGVTTGRKIKWMHETVTVFSGGKSKASELVSPLFHTVTVKIHGGPFPLYRSHCI